MDENLRVALPDNWICARQAVVLLVQAAKISQCGISDMQGSIRGNPTKAGAERFRGGEVNEIVSGHTERENSL